MHTFTVNARIYSVNGCIYSVNVRTYKNLFSGSGLSPSKVFHYERPISWITFLSHCDFGNLKKKTSNGSQSWHITRTPSLQSPFERPLFFYNQNVLQFHVYFMITPSFALYG